MSYLLFHAADPRIVHVCLYMCYLLEIADRLKGILQNEHPQMLKAIFRYCLIKKKKWRGLPHKQYVKNEAAVEGDGSETEST